MELVDERKIKIRPERQNKRGRPRNGREQYKQYMRDSKIWRNIIKTLKKVTHDRDQYRK